MFPSMHLGKFLQLEDNQSNFVAILNSVTCFRNGISIVISVPSGKVVTKLYRGSNVSLTESGNTNSGSVMVTDKPDSLSLSLRSTMRSSSVR